MAISYIGSESTDGTSVTIPAHQAGDLLLFNSFRDGSNSTPTKPADITQLDTNTTNSAGALSGYKIAASGSETSGTWTNATEVSVMVFRGVDNTTPIGDHQPATGSSTTISFPALTMTVGDGTSWVAGMAYHRSTDTNMATTPTGMTLRLNEQNGSDEVGLYDTNGGVSSWSLQTTSVGGTSSGWFGTTVELIAAGGGTQTINASLLASGNVLYTPTLVPGEVSIAPSLIASGNVLYTPTVSGGAATIAPSLLTANTTLYTPSVANTTQYILPSVLASTLTLYTPTLTGGVPTGIAYYLSGNSIPGPQSMEETNSTLYAQVQVLEGSINRDYFGDNKRMWILHYKNTKPSVYDQLRGLYSSYLSTNSALDWEVTGENYQVEATSVHVDLPSRSFSPSASHYISDFDLILTEA